VAAAVELELRDLILLVEQQHQVKVMLAAQGLDKDLLVQQAAVAGQVVLEQQVRLALQVMEALVQHHLLQVHLLPTPAGVEAASLAEQQALVEVQ
jgi:hypothetical protein